ncbi:MAG: hypothetical protein NT069_08740, partial [Planctomycetota bacterium]|nr:hypothetical protein [Planctomycetota bacterium]
LGSVESHDVTGRVFEVEGGEDFESLVLNMWLRSRDDTELERSFAELGEHLLEAQEEYLGAKELDEALFGEDYQ